MGIVTCPTEVVSRSAEHVWHLVTDPVSLARWSGSKLRVAPSAPLRAGDRLLLGAGPAGLFSVEMEILGAERPTQIRVDVRLPFGVVNHEVIVIMPISDESCRVTFN